MSARRRGLPGPFVRLWRQPLRVGAIGLLAVTALAASGIQSAAAMALRSTLDENWRGTYDILVTAPDGMQPIGGMLPPNTLASGEGLSIEQLDAVRGLGGIEVAAPIGEILVPGLKFASAQIVIPVGAVEGADIAPKAFRMTVTYTTDDGLGERVVAHSEHDLIVDEEGDRQSSEELAACIAGEWTMDGRKGVYTADPATYPVLKEAMCSRFRDSGPTATIQGNNEASSASVTSGEDFISLPLPRITETVTRIALVDPSAERALLGSDGVFLEPLIEVQASDALDTPAMTDWADRSAGDFAEQFRAVLASWAGLNADSLPPEAMEELRQLYRDNDDDYDEFMADLVADSRYAPLLIADSGVARLSLKVGIEAFGDATKPTGGASWQYTLPESLADGTPGTPIGTVAGDVSELLNPFTTWTRPLTWPGVEATYADRAVMPNPGGISVVGRLEPQPYDADERRIALSAAGYSIPLHSMERLGAALNLSDGGDVVGAEAAYTLPRRNWTSGNGAPPYAVTVGTFDATSVGIDEAAADYVPLGVYAPVSSTLTSGDHAGTTMLPSLSGLGLVSPRTVAIGSIYSAPLWDDETPISAIRVRVAGIDAYTPQNQERVIDVARAIEDLGLSASIVAGSSPADVEVQVDGYAFGTTDPAGTQAVGALGTVNQRWSELGAASRVSLSVSTATLAILGIALAAGILLLGAVQLAGVPGRREQSIVMREVGFTRTRIARWFAAEEAPGLLVVAVVATVAWVLSDGTGIAAIAGAVAVGTVFVTAAVSVVAGSRARITRMPRDARSRRLGARSVPAFGARQALVHPLTTVVHVLAITIVGLSAAALAAALVTGREDAGASSLALLTVGQQLWPQLALGAAGIVGGILLARLTRRLDLARRADQWATLRAAGWTSGQLGTAQRVEGLAVVVPGLVLTAGLTWVGAWWLQLAPVWLYLAIAVAAGLATGIIAFSTRRKGSV